MSRCVSEDGWKPGVRTRTCAIVMTMVKTLELAMAKAANLSEAAQEQLGRELLERIDSLTELRAEIDAGLNELDAGCGQELDVEDVIRDARKAHGRGR